MINQDIYIPVDLDNGDFDTPLEPEEVCQECGRPLADKNEYECPCGVTYTREKWNIIAIRLIYQ